MSEHTNNKQNNKSASKPAEPPRGPMGGRPRGGPMAMMGGEKARDFKGTMAKLFKYLGKYRVSITIILLVTAAATVFAIMGPKILGGATTALYEGIMARISGTGDIDFVKISNILLRVFLLYLTSAVLNFTQGWIMSGISTDITYRLRQDLGSKINRLPLKYFDRVSQGEVLSRVTNDVDTVSQTLNQSLAQIIRSVASVIGILVMMLSIDVTMTLIALLTIPVAMFMIRIIIKHSQKYFRTQQEYLGHVNGHVEEMYGGHIVIKAFNGEAKSIQIFNGLNEELYKSAWKSQFL